MAGRGRPYGILLRDCTFRPDMGKASRKRTNKTRGHSVPTLRRAGGHARAWTIVALALIYGIGLYARLEDYPKWREHPKAFFQQGNPVLAGGDGYYYLRLARDLDEGTYEPKDALRWYPDRPARPSPLPGGTGRPR